MDLSRVLIVSTVDVENAKNLAKEIGSEHLTDADNINYSVWTIDNKYYSAKVLLCVPQTSTIDIPPANTEAIIIHHDPNKLDDVKALDNFLPIVRNLADAEIFLLVCEYCQDSTIREKVREWSVEQKFEMVEMKNPDPTATMDEEDNICGIERVVEALQTHIWPNSTLKGESSHPRLENPQNVGPVQDQMENMRLNGETQENPNQLLMETVFDGIMGEESTDFGELIGHLVDLKRRASTLSTTSRRAAAEELVTAFWKAMCCDPSEIENLDEPDE